MGLIINAIRSVQKDIGIVRHTANNVRRNAEAAIKADAWNVGKANY